MLRNLAHRLGVCLACLLVGIYALGDRAEGYGDDDVLGVGTCRACAMTILAILSKLVALIFEVDKCPILAVALKNDATALTAVATIGATEGYELLTTEVA